MTEVKDIISAIGVGVTLLMAFFIYMQARWTRKAVETTTSAYLEGHLLLSLVPYGRSGALNLRLENLGAGKVDNVKIEFPEGLKGVDDGEIIDLVDKGRIPLQLGTLGPGGKREWFIGFAGHPKFKELPNQIAYNISYQKPSYERRWRRKKASPNREEQWGILNLSTYTGSLLCAYTTNEDLRIELEKIWRAIEGTGKPPAGPIPS